MEKIILFDFDGTIADSFKSFMTIVDRLAEKYSFAKIPQENIEELRNEEPHTLLKQLHIPLYKIPFLARDMKRMQQEIIDDIQPFMGLPEVLHELKSRQNTLGIVTSNSKDNVEMFLKKHKIDVFSFIYSDSSLFGKDKVITKAIKDQQLDKSKIMYVGDEIRDIQACRKVGIKIASVTWGFNSKSGLLAYSPDYLMENPNDLINITNNI